MRVLEDAFVNRALADAAPMLAPCFGDDLLRATITQDVRALIADAADAGGAEDVRIVKCNNDHAAIGIYHDIVENQPMPHVTLLYHTCAPGDRDQFIALRRAAMQRFADREPHGVAVVRYADRPVDATGLELRTNIVAGSLADLAGQPMPEHGGELELKPATSLDFYPTYRAWYETFWSRRPELKPQVRIESEDDMLVYLQGGGVRLVYVDGEFCGVVGAERRREFGLTGWRICEKIIAPSHWDRRLATPAMFSLARSLEDRGRDAMWGLIVPANRASLAAAQREGRRVIGGLYWIATDDRAV